MVTSIFSIIVFVFCLGLGVHQQWQKVKHQKLLLIIKNAASNIIGLILIGALMVSILTLIGFVFVKIAVKAFN